MGGITLLDKKILAIIPARAGSKSIPDKNIRLIGDKPMLAHSIIHAKESRYINRIVVSTDSIKYAEIAKGYGAEIPFIRPREYATDTSLDIDVFKHALMHLSENESYIPDLVVQLRPTYPIRNIEDIDNMIEIILNDSTIDSVRTVAPAKEIPYKMWNMSDDNVLTPVISEIPECYNMPRQELPKAYYQNACIDVIRPRVILENNSMSGNKIIGYLMTDNYDIDNEEEFLRVSNMMLQKQKTGVICTLCNSSQVDLIDTSIKNDFVNEYSMYLCNNCKTHFIYPLPCKEQLEDYYNGSFREERHGKTYYDKEKLDKVYNRFLPEAKIRLNRVVSDFKYGDRILEIGCSVGYFISQLDSKCFDLYATEWDDKARMYISDRFPEIKLSKNPEDFDMKFDKILLFHVLEHIEKPSEFIEKLKNILTPNGIIYVEVPNADDALISLYNNKKFMEHYYKKAHLFNFTKEGLEYIFNQIGMKYSIDFIQRYTLSNHLTWLGMGIPGGNNRYTILQGSVDEEYKQALIRNKCSDTLFAKVFC